ncbi:MAG: carbohydrate kinase [Clostridiales bacterium]|nr:carbohydrate kinase [Clostridiales bacterium]
MKIGTAEILNNIDKACTEKLGIPMLILMENAALKVLKHVELEIFNKYTIVCGSGNNGGDGFALARQLMALGKSVNLFFVGNLDKMSECSKINYDILRKLGLKLKHINNIEDVNELREALIETEITIDAIFGTGLSGKVEGIYDAMIAVMNENSKRIISIDIPSGLHCDTGKALGNCIRAQKTICFELYKRGFLNYESGKYVGQIIVEKIGVPENIINSFHNYEYITDAKYINANIRRRNAYNFKGDFGRTTVIAGSEGFYGAAFIATEAAVRSGSGLVTLISDSEVIKVLAVRLTEAMSVSYNSDTFIKHIKNSNSIAFGPGMGSKEKTLRVLKEILVNADCPIVIDADGLNVLAQNLNIIKNIKNKIVITPHLGEMQRLTGHSIEYIKDNRIDVAKAFAKEHKVTVLLKGYETVITDGETTYINPTGNSAMASGGMGDCLTGIIASFISQGLEAMVAAVCGAYIHGFIGEELSKEMHSVNATHIIEKLPYQLKKILDK